MEKEMETLSELRKILQLLFAVQTEFIILSLFIIR